MSSPMHLKSFRPQLGVLDLDGQNVLVHATFKMNEFLVDVTHVFRKQTLT